MTSTGDSTAIRSERARRYLSGARQAAWLRRKRFFIAIAVIGVLACAGCGGGGSSTTVAPTSETGKAQASESIKACEQAARAIQSTEITHIKEGEKSGELSGSTVAALERGAAERESAAKKRCRQATK
jgi:hypothetical protein